MANTDSTPKTRSILKLDSLPSEVTDRIDVMRETLPFLPISAWVVLADGTIDAKVDLRASMFSETDDPDEVGASWAAYAYRTAQRITSWGASLNATQRKAVVAAVKTTTPSKAAGPIGAAPTD